MDTEGLEHLLRRVQDGVVSRRQLVELGARPHDVRRMLRRRDLAVVHPGVYVDHTGPLVPEQRAWAAVLVHWPAALTRESALPGARHDGAVHVAVDHRRTVRVVPGVVAHRTADLASRTARGSAPPRIAVEHAALEVACSRTDVVDRFRVLADVAQSRRTTAADLLAVARTRRGLPHRVEVMALLDDLEQGACSVLEREYLRLERRHGLGSRPAPARRQVPDRVRGGRIFRDVDLDDADLAIELDGRAFHDSATARDRDAVRDLESAVAGGRLTVRLTWSMVVRDGCRTMASLAVLAARRGSTWRPVRCADCPVDA